MVQKPTTENNTDEVDWTHIAARPSAICMGSVARPSATRVVYVQQITLPSKTRHFCITCPIFNGECSNFH